MSGFAIHRLGACWQRALVRVAAGLAIAASAASATAQSSMAQCRAALPEDAAAQLRRCEEHSGCRAVVRVIDACPPLQTFLRLLAGNGAKVDDSSLRRTLVEAGVPPPGIASCTTEFNRALCRNFLSLEDASGETGAGPNRLAQFQTAVQRLVDQQEAARVPADAHREAVVRLEACARARPGAERESACREAIQAVQACDLARQEWTQRREVLLVDAIRLGQTNVQPRLRSLEMPACARTLPGSTLTPQEALVAGEGADGSPANVPPATSPPAATAPGAAPAPAGASNTEAAGGDCRTALRRMEDRFEAIQRRRPAQADRLATQQVEIYMLTEQVGLLERQCRGQREFEFLRPTQERLARTLQACRDTAASPVNDCVPRVPW